MPLVLNGHEHFYQRTCPVKDGQPAQGGAGTTYIITGGGGAKLYPFYVHPLTAYGASVFEYVKVHIDGLRMVVSALDANRLEFDRVEIAPPPAIRDLVNAADQRPALARVLLPSCAATTFHQTGRSACAATDNCRT